MDFSNISNRLLTLISATGVFGLCYHSEVCGHLEISMFLKEKQV